MDSFLILSLIFLLGFSAFFSASETALFSLSSMRIKAYQTDMDYRKRLIARLVLKPRDLLVTVFMLNTLSNILIQNVTSSMFGEEAGWGLKVALPLTATLFICEIIPKYLGLQYNVPLAVHVAPAINFFQKTLSPIRRKIVAITTPISRVLFFFLKKEPEISKEELQHVLQTSEAYGVLKPQEAELVRGYLSLQDMLVKELMHPREDLFGYGIHEPISKAIYLFAEKKHAQIPVFDKHKDNVIGVLSAKDFLLHKEEITETKRLDKYLSKPLFIPENSLARKLLRKLYLKKQQISIVVDEYGVISGYITREDILQVILAKAKELDHPVNYTQAGEQEIIASGKLELSVFNEIFKSDLISPSNMVTIGGWLIEQMGEIPKAGTKYQTAEFLFHILNAEPNRIKRLYIRKLTRNNEHKKAKRK